eukprot:TRINITY_DN888_c0_g2_i2.p1 TRINITY_DN888_c0_g2~~TRINITY_DN888_c0_g2_i2.p1  ORF type:complete len:434 (+),score=30.47 TRINITY_DN888_c0_g2_i2:34-1335(+)
MGNSEGRQHYWDSDTHTSDPRFPHPRLRDYYAVVGNDYRPRSNRAKAEARWKLHCPYNIVMNTGACYLLGLGMGAVISVPFTALKRRNSGLYVRYRTKLRKIMKKAATKFGTRMGRWGFHFFAWDCIWAMARGRHDSTNIILGAASLVLTLQRSVRIPKRKRYKLPIRRNRNFYLRTVRKLTRATAFFLFFEIMIFAVFAVPKVINSVPTSSRHYITELETLKDTPWNTNFGMHHKRQREYFVPGYLSEVRNLRPAHGIPPEKMAEMLPERLGIFAEAMPKAGQNFWIEKWLDDKIVRTIGTIREDTSEEETAWRETSKLQEYTPLGMLWQRDHLQYWADIAKLEMMIRTKPNPGVEDLVPKELSDYYKSNPRTTMEVQYITMEAPSYIPWFMSAPDVPEHGYIPIPVFNPRTDKKIKRMTRFVKRFWGSWVV